MAPHTRSARLPIVATADSGSGFRTAQQGTFRKEGEYWTVGYGAKTVRLKNTRGLGYLANLLRYPTVEFHVLNLLGGTASQRKEDETGESDLSLPRGTEDLKKAGIHVTRPGDAGDTLDERAKVAYGRRVSELKEELQRAKKLGNVERADQAEEEIDALTKELSRVIGLGGRSRRAASASERARQSIAKAIKSVLDRIAQSDATLGDLFSRCIKTGTFCSYQPDPDFPIAWEFAATGVDSAIEPVVRALKTGDLAPTRAKSSSSHARAAQVVLEAFPFSAPERTAFVGRESEAGAIRTVIDRAEAGQGSLVMLWGGPGVGKTRLAMEMTEYASRVGFRCAVGRCYESTEPLPYLPFVEMLENGIARTENLDIFRREMGENASELAQMAPSLRRIFPDIPQPLELPQVQQSRYLFQSVSEGLAHAARRRPHLVILEDLHWADESTLALLTHLASLVARLPLVIFGSYRSGRPHHNPVLARTLEELIRMGIRPIKLSGLSKDGVAQMLHGLSRRQVPESLARLIFDETEGNPFLVEELYRHLVEQGKIFDAAGQFRTDIKIDEVDIPENVRLIVDRRLDLFDENEELVLAAAAMIGRSFSFQLLTAVSEFDIDELFAVIEKAQQMGIIIPSSEGPDKPFAFAHELVRQTLLAGISAPRRQQLHTRVADVIEQGNPRP
jgi:hypothetical protein